MVLIFIFFSVFDVLRCKPGENEEELAKKKVRTQTLLSHFKIYQLLFLTIHIIHCHKWRSRKNSHLSSIIPNMCSLTMKVVYLYFHLIFQCCFCSVFRKHFCTCSAFGRLSILQIFQFHLSFCNILQMLEFTFNF